MRYARQIAVEQFGESAQEKAAGLTYRLATGHNPEAEATLVSYLAGAGVGTIRLTGDAIVETPTVHLLSSSDAGHDLADSLVKRALQLNGNISVSKEGTGGEILPKSDTVFAALLLGATRAQEILLTLGENQDAR